MMESNKPMASAALHHRQDLAVRAARRVKVVPGPQAANDLPQLGLCITWSIIISISRHETSGSSDPSNTNAQQVTTAPGRRHQHQDAGQLPSAAQKNSLTSDWESVMSERRARVSHICRRHYKTLKRFTVFDRLTFDTKHHLAYCRNAKAGTTSWLRTLLEWAGEDVSNMTSLQIHEAAIDTFPPLTAKDAAREMQVPPITFIMARHPFTRLVSAYRDKIPKNYKRNLQLEMIAKYRGQQINNSSSEDESSALETSLRHTKLIENKKMNDIKINSRSSHQESIVMRNDSLSVNEAPHEIQLTTNSSFMTTSDTSFPSFREFVLYVSDQVLLCLPYINSNCMKNIDVHWQPLHDRCAPCDIQYDVIAKVETFAEDEKYLSQLMGLPLKHTEFSRLHIARGTPTADFTRTYFSTLSNSERDKVFRAFYYDFLLFGYSYDMFFR
ncbi:carbohydrate sulfotransferase 11-like [Panulirus ornatus]|uniref:carbohydrate sulfotransferase 11-like n=1 Tax=Panulirus ornatus TaxID=150431 RepID=UPI003A8A51EA